MTPDPMAATKGRHPIQVVSRRTGLAAERIRQWERRYSIVSPERTEGGHRLYSDEDVERLRLLARVVEAGRRISDVASMSALELIELAQEDAAHASSEPLSGARGDPGEALEDCMERLILLDAPGFEALLKRSASRLGLSRFVTGVAAPLLERIGEGWEEGDIRPAQEHIGSAVMRTVLAELASDAGGPDRQPRLVVATPQGALHEMGALMIVALASEEGWAVTYLGPDLPAEDVAWVAETTGARAVALSIVHPAGDLRIESDLRNLRSAIRPTVSLILGGRAASSYENGLRAPGCYWPRLDQFAETLRTLA